MKKIIGIIICLLVVIGCSSNNQSKEKLYYDLLDNISSNKSFPKINNLNIEIYQNESSYEKQHYEILISQPKIEFNNLRIIAYPIGYEYNELLPNFNVLEEVDIESFNKKQTAIKLNFFSLNEYENFKVLIQYKNSKTNENIINESEYKTKKKVSK